MAFKAVTLPINFSSIGVDFTLTYDNRAELVNPAVNAPTLTKILKVPAANNKLKSCISKGKTIFSVQPEGYPSNITIGEKVYRVVAHAGNGSYGSTCIVACDIDGGENEQRFVLKEQISKDDASDIQFLNEGLINYILNQATADGQPPFSSTIHKIFYSERLEQTMIYCMIDLLALDGHRFLAGVPNDTHRNGIIFNMYRQFVDRLSELYDKFEFNHGDFKPPNCMYDHQDNLRLIDYGLSRLKVSDASGRAVIIGTNQFNTVSSKSQDITNMAVLTAHTFPLPAAAAAFLGTIINGYGCNLVKYSTGIICNIPGGTKTLRNMGDLYKLCDQYENLTGTFDVVRQALALPANAENVSGPISLGYTVSTLIAPRGPGMRGGAKLINKRKHAYRIYARSSGNKRNTKKAKSKSKSKSKRKSRRIPRAIK